MISIKNSDSKDERDTGSRESLNMDIKFKLEYAENVGLGVHH
jgi:hypothetical protein